MTPHFPISGHQRSSAVKPVISQVPLAQALQWRGGGPWRFEEKIDGQFHLHEFGGDAAKSVLAGELLKRPTPLHPAGFYAFDILRFQDQDVSRLPLHERLPLLAESIRVHSRSAPRGFPANLFRVAAGAGAEFLEHILALGGEGLVAKPLNTPYGGGWLKAKRSQNFICRVTALPGSFQSVAIEETDFSLAARRLAALTPAVLRAWGRVALFGGKCDRVRLGSLLKITGYGLTALGKIRDPRPDTDTPASWLIQY